MNAERWTRDQMIAHLSLLGWEPVWLSLEPRSGRGITAGRRLLWLCGEGVPASGAGIIDRGPADLCDSCDWGKLGYYFLEAFVEYLGAN